MLPSWAWEWFFPFIKTKPFLARIPSRIIVTHDIWYWRTTLKNKNTIETYVSCHNGSNKELFPLLLTLRLDFQHIHQRWSVPVSIDWQATANPCLFSAFPFFFSREKSWCKRRHTDKTGPVHHASMPAYFLDLSWTSASYVEIHSIR